MKTINTVISIRPKPLRAGGEENDISGGLDIYKNIAENVITITISNSQQEVKHEYVQLNSGQPKNKRMKYSKIKLIAKYLLLKLIIIDPSMRENTKLKYCKKVQEICDLFPGAIIVNETSGMFPLSIFSKHRISRSNNFEPIHCFRENIGLKKYLYFIPKITGVLLERLLSNVFVISSQDLRYYKYFWSPKKICVVPLRNLVVANKNIYFDENNVEIYGIAYLSSTFNVKHNSDGVKFLVNKVFNKPEMDNFVLNIYGSKISSVFSKKNVIVHGWVHDIEEIYENNSIFLAVFGGTGQQSKIFEPMSRGKVVILNPKLVKNQNLVSGTHYLSASNDIEYAKHILDSKINPIKFQEIGRNAFDYCKELFSYEKNLNTITHYLNIS
jgi:hypothetical protein